MSIREENVKFCVTVGSVNRIAGILAKSDRRCILTETVPGLVCQWQLIQDFVHDAPVTRRLCRPPGGNGPLSLRHCLWGDFVS